MKYAITTYNKNSRQSVINYAKQMKGLTFEDILNNANLSMEERERYAKGANKGSLGILVEEVFFGYRANNIPDADFKNIGVELKVTPMEYNKDGDLKAKERLVLSDIPQHKEWEGDTLEQAPFWKKAEWLLLVIYLFIEKYAEEKFRYEIKFVELFTPSEEDLLIMRADYKLIRQKYIDGQAHEVSEGETLYLGASTKGATAAKSLKPQFYNSQIKAKTRAWCYKVSYMTFVIQTRFQGLKKGCDPIFSSERKQMLLQLGFAQSLESIVANFIGKTKSELVSQFNINVSKTGREPKHFYSILASRMLQASGSEDKLEEFEKAGICVKAVRLNSKGKMVEHLRLQDANLDNLAIKNLPFEESEFGEILDSLKIFFVVFKDNGKEQVFKGGFLWNMPYSDLKAVEKDFIKTQKVVSRGIKFKITKKGNDRVGNNLPKASKTKVFHLRPHASKALYILGKEKQKIGSGKLSDTVEVPVTGERCTRQAYWLNKSYVLPLITNKFPELAGKD